MIEPMVAPVNPRMVSTEQKRQIYIQIILNSTFITFIAKCIIDMVIIMIIDRIQYILDIKIHPKIYYS